MTDHPRGAPPVAPRPASQRLRRLGSVTLGALVALSLVPAGALAAPSNPRPSPARLEVPDRIVPEPPPAPSAAPSETPSPLPSPSVTVAPRRVGQVTSLPAPAVAEPWGLLAAREGLEVAAAKVEVPASHTVRLRGPKTGSGAPKKAGKKNADKRKANKRKANKKKAGNAKKSSNKKKAGKKSSKKKAGKKKANKKANKKKAGNAKKSSNKKKAGKKKAGNAKKSSNKKKAGKKSSKKKSGKRSRGKRRKVGRKPRKIHTRSAGGSYAMPLPRRFLTRRALRNPHHDYPAWDIGVPRRTPVFSVTAGRVRRIFNDSRCGRGLEVRGNDGMLYVYCHGRRVVARRRQWVGTGSVIMRSGNTGRSTGPHLHLQIKRGSGSLVCPQGMLQAVADRKHWSASMGTAGGCHYYGKHPWVIKAEKKARKEARKAAHKAARARFDRAKPRLWKLKGKFKQTRKTYHRSHRMFKRSKKHFLKARRFFHQTRRAARR